MSLFPRHLHYVETHGGGASVLLARDPDDKRFWIGDTGSTRGVSEVYNDIDGVLANFWTVLGNPHLFPEFFRLVNCVPLSKDFWATADACLEGMQFHAVRNETRIIGAVDFFVCCRQSMSGRRKNFTPLTRNRVRRGMNGNVSEWLGAVDGLPDVHERLRRVVVENMDAVKLIRREDTPHTFFYLDPPYLHETRVTTDAYHHEMTREQHEELLATLGAVKGKFILSGYRNELYDRIAAERQWHRKDIDIANHAAGGKSKRRMTESLWMNYNPEERRNA